MLWRNRGGMEFVVLKYIYIGVVVFEKFLFFVKVVFIFKHKKVCYNVVIYNIL